MREELCRELASASYGAPAEHESPTLEVTVEILDDEFTSVRDYECWGEFSEYRYDWRDGQVERPDGFDGNAEKLRSGGDFVWWQPPRGDYEFCKRGTPEFDELRSTVRDLCEYGFVTVHVTGRVWRETQVGPMLWEHWEYFEDYLGGVESMFMADYLASIIDDMLPAFDVVAAAS